MSEKRKDVSVLIPDARLSYLYVYEPYKGEDGTGKFGCTAIINPDDPVVAEIKAAQRAVAQAKWGDKANDILTQLAAQDRLCLHRGDVSKAGKPEFAGKLFINAANAQKPRVAATIDGVTQDVDKSSEFSPYSGCFGAVKVDIWAMDNKFGKRINASLSGVKFLRHGDRLSGGGRVASLDEFGVDPAQADAPAPATGASGLI